MPKRKSGAMENPTARDIFNELDLYAKDRQFYPLQNALYGYMTRFMKDASGKLVLDENGKPKRHYNLSISTFNWWFSRLVEEGFIVIDRETRSIRAVHLQIVEKEDAHPLEKNGF